MKQFVLRAALAGVLCAPTLAAAGPYLAAGDNLTVTDGVGSYGGGEFLIRAAGTSTFDSFVTFCVQLHEPISPNGSTVYQVSAVSATGLAAQTAFLYQNFRNGTLAGYSSTDLAASALQWAIWSFQGQSGIPTVTAAVRNLANSFMLAANNAVSSGAWSGAGNVRIATLLTTAGAAAQDQLTLVDPGPQPVPEPASLLLLGMAVAGLASRARRRS